MSKTTIAVRSALPQDCALLLKLINKLAVYEKLAHEVLATESDIHTGLFGSQSNAAAIIAELAGEPVGFALFFHNYSTFTGRRGLYLEDLFVLENYRGLGVGYKLFQRLAQIAVERNCARFEWSVLDWNEPAIRFYESMGAQPMSDWTVYRLSGEKLNALAARH
jgi:GNAT superfamily N-acetyltransferase